LEGFAVALGTTEALAASVVETPDANAAEATDAELGALLATTFPQDAAKESYFGALACESEAPYSPKAECWLNELVATVGSVTGLLEYAQPNTVSCSVRSKPPVLYACVPVPAQLLQPSQTNVKNQCVELAPVPHVRGVTAAFVAE
jgi:hypothetical protein